MRSSHVVVSALNKEFPVNKYKKAPKYVGKYLNITIGRADKRIDDGVVYEGIEYEQYVGLGFLVRVPDSEKTTPPEDVKTEGLTAPDYKGAQPGSLADKAQAALEGGRKPKGAKKSDTQSDASDDTQGDKNDTKGDAKGEDKTSSEG